MARSRAQAQGGFVITLELVLIFTILGIGLLVGIVAVRNALFVYWQKKKAQTVWVYDSADPIHVLGPVRDFDEHETPRLFYVDRTLSGADPDNPPSGVLGDWAGNNFRAFVGVRGYRFTSRHRIFYTNSADCGVTSSGSVSTCIAGAGRDDQDDLAVGEPPIVKAGGIGYLYELQGGPSYGIGRGIAPALPETGSLYRQSTATCDPTTIGSAWASQTVGEACSPYVFPPPVTSAFCPKGGGCNYEPGGPASLNCVDTGSECACPDGYYRATGLSGNNCCPIGTEFDQNDGVCRGGSGVFVAVPDVDSLGTPVLEELAPPCRVSLPPDPTSFTLIGPGGGEGTPGIATNTPYDPTGGLAFDSPAPDGQEGPP
jgi:hypothetical protein